MPRSRFLSAGLPPCPGPTRASVDVARHLEYVATHCREWEKITWVVDNLDTHWSLDVCRMLAKLNRLAFRPDPLSTGSERKAFLTDGSHRYKLVFTPTHGSWLNQVEPWFNVLNRRFLKRGDFASASEFETRLTAYLEAYNAREKHPYRWTYTGQPLVRGTPGSQTRRQRRHGRAWLGPRPKRFERLLDPPRPYKRRPNK